MTSLNVSLPQSMKGFIEFQAKAGGYSTASEYVRALIREDQKRAAMQALERELLKGLQSGEPIEVNDEFWSDLRSELKRKLSKPKPTRHKASSR